MLMDRSSHWFSRIRRSFQRFVVSTSREEGSLVVAIAVIAILGMFGAAFATQSLGDLHYSSLIQEQAQARAQAEGGLNAALWQLDHLTPGKAASLVTNPQFSGGSSHPSPAASYSYTATFKGSYFSILSTGKSYGISYTLHARAEPETNFPFAIFGKDSLTLNGSASTTSITGILGTEGSLKCDGNGNYGDAQFMPKSSSASSDSESSSKNGGPGCNPEPLPTPYDPHQPVSSCQNSSSSGDVPSTPCLPSEYFLCPSSSSSNTGEQVITGAIMPGVYYCTGSVVFSGNVSVVNESTVNQGEAQIFIFPSGSQVPNLTFESAGKDNPIAINTQGSNPAQLQIYMAGNGSISIGRHTSSNNSSASASGSPSSSGKSSVVINAMLWAPDATMTINSPLSWSGSLIVGSFTMEGTPKLSVTYKAPLTPGPLVSWGLSDFYTVPQS
ncbi:MAG: hypothetical protein M1519_02770 [Actinobacteria bacterium]|jgi:hypothetical protein|nr:hypothetical protein [Actinomycetota bacterium]